MIHQTGLDNPNYKHGMSETRFYRIWKGMKNRTSNPNLLKYKDYGGRGIHVCERWDKFENFRDDMYESYLAHVEEHGEKYTTIDRIDNEGNYEPSNCRWATQLVQSLNQRVRKDGILYKSKLYTVLQFAELSGLTYHSVKTRLRKGWTLEEILKVPKGKHKRKYLGY